MTHNPWIAGVDEAGRGPLAGPVIAAAVVLNPELPIVGLQDSKKISAKKREQLFDEIQTHALAFAIGRAEHQEIDAINILQATMLAMQRAIASLPCDLSAVLVDGNRCPDIAYPCQAIIGGDASQPAISAASILAKVTRDREMVARDKDFPGYGFAQHKGYPTKKHLEALQQLGVSSLHRRSFAPVRRCLNP